MYMYKTTQYCDHAKIPKLITFQLLKSISYYIAMHSFLSRSLPHTELHRCTGH